MVWGLSGVPSLQTTTHWGWLPGAASEDRPGLSRALRRGGKLPLPGCSAGKPHTSNYTSGLVGFRNGPPASADRGMPTSSRPGRGVVHPGTSWEGGVSGRAGEAHVPIVFPGRLWSTRAKRCPPSWDSSSRLRRSTEPCISVGQGDPHSTRRSGRSRRVGGVGVGSEAGQPSQGDREESQGETTWRDRDGILDTLEGKGWARKGLPGYLGLEVWDERVGWIGKTVQLTVLAYDPRSRTSRGGAQEGLPGARLRPTRAAAPSSPFPKSSHPRGPWQGYYDWTNQLQNHSTKNWKLIVILLWIHHKGAPI